MNIVVTGNAGFMGSHLVDSLLKEGHRVIGIDNLSGGFLENINSGCDFIKHDLRKPISFKSVDTLFHLAADATEGRSQFTPLSATENNLVAYINALKACIKGGVKKVVLTSSMSRYGDQKPPFTEDMSAKPVDVYGVNKEAMENVTKILATVYGYDWTIIAPHNVFGERQNIGDPYRNVVGIFMNRIMRGEPPLIYGDGEQTRAFTYIDNFTPYIMKAAFDNSCKGELINIGPTQEYTVNYLARVVLDAMGSNLEPTYYPDRPLEVKHAYCSVQKAEKLLGYKTTVSFEDGISRMAKWALKRGPREWKYIDLELETKETPKTWTQKTM